MDEYIEIKLDIFEHIGQRARLRRSVTVKRLIEEILKEFDDISDDSQKRYVIFLKGTDQPLNLDLTISQLNIQPNDEFVFDFGHIFNRRWLNVEHYAFLRDETNGQVYDVQWQPALIGRPTNEAEHNIMLAVNLQLHPNGMTVSRRHAEITFSNGCYFIEQLAENNPIAVNEKVVPFGTQCEVRHGDRINLGRGDVALTFLTQITTSTNLFDVPVHTSAKINVDVPEETGIILSNELEADTDKTDILDPRIPDIHHPEVLEKTIGASKTEERKYKVRSEADDEFIRRLRE